MTSPQPVPRRTVSEFANDPEMAELVELFVSEMPERIAALQRAWEEKHLTDLTRLSHQLKGASAGYGFPTIGTAAAVLEADLKRLNGAEQAIDALAKQFQDLIDLCTSASGKA
jgi:HPt (histidine-containing phosphotransfer) domain-containing protein